MLKRKSSLELKGIAQAGGSLEVDGSSISGLELQGIARMLTAGATLKIHNADGLSGLEMQGIAKLAPGRVIFA